MRASRDDDTKWEWIPSPAGMDSCPKHIAVTYDGEHHVHIAFAWWAKLWRYVEP
jgi:hypothetical protein